MSLSTMPAELLQSVFDSFELPFLVSCAHVCHSWRMLARSHPTYWKELFITDDCVTSSSAAFFVDRLNARPHPDSTFTLFLRCAQSSPLMADVVMPAVLLHVHRVRELTLLFTPDSASLVIPLFTVKARFLTVLNVLINDACPDMPPIPALFQAHSSSALRRVILFDVPLSPDIPPVRHVVETVQALYLRTPELLPRALSWVPHSRVLDAFSLEDRYLPRPFDISLATTSHLALYTEEWLLVPQIAKIATLLVRISQPSICGIDNVVPRTGPLCACIRIGKDCFLPDLSPSGQAALTTRDGAVVRYFEHLDEQYIASTAFLEAILPLNRLVVLAVSVDLVFDRLCDMKAIFPLLETLVLGVDVLPPEDDWATWGSVGCPKLRTLAVQRQGILPVSASGFSLAGFIRITVLFDQTAPPRLVLRGVGISTVEGDDSLTDSAVMKNDRPWFDRRRSTNEGAMSGLESMINIPYFSWMDLP
ncbi:hypothetical protein AURDEDRAFT_173118 [Auricularia subglabra TFB-10046 SS5]|nr:hypothetical protein AURDEDRAFT_173118 [Auricularia subglabra TFB-10046 SS5]